MSSNPFAKPFADLRANIYEKLDASATASDYVRDFVHSDDPKFAGDTKKKRIKRALAAYYEKQRNEEYEIDDREQLKEYIISSLKEAESLTARKKSEDEDAIGMDGSQKIDPKNVRNKIEINPVLRPTKSN